MKVLIISLVLFISGCASMGQQRPIDPPVANAKIGFMYLGDKYPKHLHVGTTVFQNFEIKNASKTDYSVKMIDVIKSLMSEKTYQYVEIDGSNLPEKEQIEPFGFYTGKPKELFKNLVSKSGEQHNLDYIIVIQPIRGEAFVNSTVYVHGFGLYTQCRMGNCLAEALNYQDIDILKYPALESVDLWNWKYHSRRPVQGIPFGEQLKILDEEKIDSAADVFLKHFEDLTREKLIWARFIDGEFSEEN